MRIGLSHSQLCKPLRCGRTTVANAVDELARAGKKVARLHGKAFKEKRAQLGGQACLIRYGREYYQAIRARRTSY